MATTTPKKYPVELTLGEVIELAAVLKSAWDNEGYSANRKPKVDDDTGETLPLEDWERTSRDRAIAKRDRLNAVHFALTGTNLVDES
jgi:hypothetical protein